MNIKLTGFSYIIRLCALIALAAWSLNSHAQLKTSGIGNAKTSINFEHLIQGQALQVVSVSMRFFDEVEAHHLKAALSRFDISVESFRFVNEDTNGEVGTVSGDSLDSSFERLSGSELRLLNVQNEMLNKRLSSVNATSEQLSEVAYLIRMTEWQKQEVLQYRSKIIGMEVRGAANLVKNFCEENAFVKIANITPSRKR